jgi:hypothetical protein
MGADLQQLKFANGDWLTAEEKDNIIKWEAMYRIYKGIEGRYKTAVGEGEAQFYTVKSMEKMVKNGSYSGKKEEFKALYQKTNASLAQLLTEAGAIDKEISAIEPINDYWSLWLKQWIVFPLSWVLKFPDFI